MQDLTPLTGAVAAFAQRWSLTIGEPFHHEGRSWVAPVTRADGSSAVLKLAFPHMEGRDEAAGLHFWHGDGAVRLLDADDDLCALLLERCEPGTPLRDRPEREQDEVIATLLQRLWRRPPEPHPFRHLSEMTAYWATTTRGAAAVFDELHRTAPTEVLLATDLHAGNVLRAEREPWLAIDPKPFVGDPAYDATQHLLNCRDPQLERFAALLDVDPERVRLWLAARRQCNT
jgi:streptomycin 6-kinase